MIVAFRVIGVLVALLGAGCRGAAISRDVAGAAALPTQLFRPAGDGPFPAVLLMHGCGGTART